jgi:hypothetical protein
MSKRGTMVADDEMALMYRICRELALLTPERRAVVLAYVNSRQTTLPVVAAVGGGTETDERVPMLQFPERERANHEGDAA